MFSHKLYLDTEVKAPFKGALDHLALDVYSRHPGTRLLLFPYAIDRGPIKLWDMYHAPDRAPFDLVAALKDPSTQLIAHGAQYDRVVLMNRMSFTAPLTRWYCTAARARIHGLPGGLDMLSAIFKLGAEGKQAERGKELIELFCEQAADPDEHPVEWLEFCDYAMHDVGAMRRLDEIMPAWCFTPTEQRRYQLDQKINDRGFMVDLPMAQCMIDASTEVRVSLDAQTHELSGGTITKATQRDAVKKFIDNDPQSTFTLDNMRAETLRKALRDEQLTDDQREMIELRLLTARSSVSKCKTALAQAGPGSRIRYSMTYAGGGRIARQSHKGFQPGNMPRPSQAFKKKEMVAAAVEAIHAGLVVTIWGDEAQSVCADSIRGLIIAPPGKKLVQADYTGIEPRQLSWYAGEDWKLQVYRDQDAKIGEDSYKITFSRMTGIPIDAIDDFLRQQGKGADLSMGYEGGVGAFLNISNSYQIDLVKLAQVAPKTMPPEMIEKGAHEWEWAVKENKTLDLPREIYVACSANKHAWREAHPATVGLWRGLLDCAKTAVQNPGKLFQCAHAKVLMKATDHWLAIQVPSGRKIMLAKPKMVPEVKRNAKGEEYITYKLTALKAPMWFRESIYGGLLANLITQGNCRDILWDGMEEADAEDFPIILDVHDEILAELDEGDPRDHTQLIDAMLRPALKKYPGLPLTAAGYTAKRYRKG